MGEFKADYDYEKQMKFRTFKQRIRNKYENGTGKLSQLQLNHNKTLTSIIVGFDMRMALPNTPNHSTEKLCQQYLISADNHLALQFTS